MGNSDYTGEPSVNPFSNRPRRISRTYYIDRAPHQPRLVMFATLCADIIKKSYDYTHGSEHLAPGPIGQVLGCIMGTSPRNPLKNIVSYLVKTKLNGKIDEPNKRSTPTDGPLQNNNKEEVVADIALHDSGAFRVVQNSVFNSRSFLPSCVPSRLKYVTHLSPPSPFPGIIGSCYWYERNGFRFGWAHSYFFAPARAGEHTSPIPFSRPTFMVFL